jgi:hypothetical protein
MQYKKNTTTLFALNYWYKTDSTNCPSAPSAGNGQVRCINDSVDNGRSVVYGYDPLYRLTTAVTTGSTAYPKWGLSETYDRYGNRSAQAVTAGSGPSNSVTINATNNRISGSPYAYDANGNMTNDGSNTLVYDGESQLASSTGGSGSGTYTFDGHGLRVKKVSGGTTTVTIFSGRLDIAEYFNGAAPSAPGNEFIYSGSQRILLIQSGTNYYLHNDHLSLRVRTNSSGAVADDPESFTDLDGHEDGLFQAILESIPVKGSLGIGLGGDFKLLGTKVEGEVAYKFESKINLAGHSEINGVFEAQAGSTLKIPGAPEVTVGPKFSQSTPLARDGRMLPAQEQKTEPTESSLGLKIGKNEGSASKNDVTLAGVSVCAGVCAGVEAGVDLKNFKDPGAPPTPKPPAPPNELAPIQLWCGKVGTPCGQKVPASQPPGSPPHAPTGNS